MRLVSAFALCLLSGCYAAHDLEGAPTAPPRDGAVSRDAGAPGVRDAGVVDPRPRDSGMVVVDPGDAGPGAPLCGSEVPRPDRSACSERTRECLARCEDSDCDIRCLDRDPACFGCVLQSLVRCVNARGCQGNWDGLTCCAEGASPACQAGARRGDPRACVEECGDALMPFEACFVAKQRECGGEVNDDCGV